MVPTKIHTWYQYRPLQIGNFQNSLLRIKIGDSTPLPQKVEEEVSRNWEEQKTSAHRDNLVLFLSGKPQEKNGILTIPTQARGFRYVAAFSRNPSFHSQQALLHKYKLLYLSTHSIVVTKDNKIILGTKKNQFNQISNFGGFPQVKEESQLVGGERYLDIKKCIENRLQAEVPSADCITSIHAIGITHVDRPGLQGCDTNYIVRVSQTADQLIHKFVSTYDHRGQFKRQLFQVPFQPQPIMTFVKEMHHQNNVFSPFALGCLAITFNAFFDGAAQLHKLIKDVGIDIASGNQTKYLQT